MATDTRPGEPTSRRALLAGTGAPVMIALVSIPVLVLCWLLLGAWQRHERQAQDAQDVIDVYRTGLAVFPPLERMRALSRIAYQLDVTPQGESLYDQAVGEAQTHMDIFLARVGQRAERVPTLEAPLGRMEQMPWLEEIVIDVEADPLGPLPAITRYADGIHRLLSSVLYGADLSERRGAQATEMLLLIPDTVRRLRYELALLQVLALPADMAPGDFYSGDLKELDRAWNALIDLTDTFEGQLLDIEQRQGLLPEGKDPGQLQALRDYIDFIDDHLILGTGGVTWAEAWPVGLRAQQAVNAIEEGLVDAAEARLLEAQSVQRRNDLLMAGGLVLLYAAIVYFMLQYYRSRDAAQRERDLQREIEDRRRREQELMQLNQLSEALMACQGEAQACDAFAQSAAGLFPGLRGALALYSRDAGGCRLACHWGGEAPPLAQSFDLLDCRAMHDARPLRFGTHEECCSHYPPGAMPHGAHACVPMIVDGEPLGLFWLDGVSADASDLQLAVSATETLKLALTNIRLRETLQEQAVRDALTGLYNRRQLLDVFPREMAHAVRTGQPLAIAVLDIDHFKQVNDTWGHDAGDQALVALARHMREHLRASDFVFRMGGEEFVLLLRTDLLGGRKAVDNLRASFRDKRFRFQEAAPVQLSFSAGVVEAPLFGEDLDALLRLADEALYRAKAGGRDRVELAEPPPPSTGQVGVLAPDRS